MPQPYDLSGIASAQITVNQMLTDQQARVTEFAGGAETWIPKPVGAFTAILAPAGAPVATTTDAIRITLKQLRTLLDLIAGGTGTTAAQVIQAATPPTVLLETGSLPTGPTGASGPIVNSPSVVQATAYDLSGLSTLLTGINQMLTDMQTKVTTFVGNAAFNAIIAPAGPTVSTNMAAVMASFRALAATFDLLNL